MAEEIRKPFLPLFSLTTFMIGVCVALFFWSAAESAKIYEARGKFAVEVELTPLEQVMVFDYPHAFAAFSELLERYPIQSLKEIPTLPPAQRALYEEVEAIPSWKGLYPLLLESKHPTKEEGKPVLFEKIRQGEVWRLISPVLMHRGILHILFNMAWLWILGRQIEERLGKMRMILFMLLVGVISNVLQYLMSGPFFLGYSGIVVGMAGFIWVRQKKAPWEGYPLPKATALFILIFVLAMCALEIFSFSLHALTPVELAPNIANTAHVVGGICGMILGRFPFFARRPELT